MIALTSPLTIAEREAPASARTPGVAVSARGLAKAFGVKRVLSGLDLQIPAGKFVAIVGRSGCGKSTLLRVAAGLEPADAGRVEVTGAAGGVTAA